VQVSRVCSRLYRSTSALVIIFLGVLFACGVGASDNAPAGITVQMNPQKPLWLRVTLRSFASTRVTVYKHLLPWGSNRAMVVTAVTEYGQTLEQDLSIDDPSFAEVSFDPNGSLSGDIDLHELVRNIDGAVKKSDVHLFWAYKAPQELQLPRWSGGWVLIPQEKRR